MILILFDFSPGEPTKRQFTHCITTVHLLTYLYAECVLGCMSATTQADVSTTIDGCRPVDVTPIVLDDETLDSTVPSYLSELKRTLSGEGLQPAQLRISARFDDDCSFTTQDELDRIREYVRAASFLGAGTVTVRVEAVADASRVQPGLEACAERARREGLQFSVEGPTALSV